MSLLKIIKAEKKKADLLLTPRWEAFISRNRDLWLDESSIQFIFDELGTPERDRTNHFSASSQGFCERRQVFNHEGVPPKPTDSDIHMIFHDGHFRHLKWQALMLYAGLIDEVEVSCELEEFNLKGTIDAMATHPERGKHGVEFKGANDRNYKFVLNEGPMEKHLLQIHAYMIATDYRLWSLIYENKNTQEWKEFVIEFDQQIADEVIDSLKRMNTSVQQKVLPPVLSKCLDRKGPFRACPYSHICLDIPEPGWVKVKDDELIIKRAS